MVGTLRDGGDKVNESPDLALQSREGATSVVAYTLDSDWLRVSKGLAVNPNFLPLFC